MASDTTSVDIIESMFYHITEKEFGVKKKQKYSTLLLCQVAIFLSKNETLSAAEIRNWIANFCKITNQGKNRDNIVCIYNSSY